jgi:phage-related protein
MASAVWNAIKDICRDALNSAKSFFGISSPSKVMRDQVGKWLPEGMAVGIEDNTGVIDKAMSDLTDEAMGEIGGSVQSVVSIQSGNTRALNKSSVNGTVATDTMGVNAIIDALSRVTVTMDGRTVGNLVATPVNNALGRLNVRRT